MTNYLKKSLQALAAGALALALPIMAQAAPLAEGIGSNTILQPGVLYEYDMTHQLGAGPHTFLFGLTPQASPGDALTTEISINANDIHFDFFRVSGPNGIFNHTDLLAGGNGFIAAIENIPFVLGGFYELTLGFSLDNAASTLVNVQIQTVPLPAAGLLLLAGLGGLGFVARRRKSNAA